MVPFTYESNLIHLGFQDPDFQTITIMDQIMQEQVLEAFVRVKSILSDVKQSIISVSSPSQFLPNISDIISEISEVVACVQQVILRKLA